MSRVLRVTGGSFIIQAGITLAHALLAKRIDTRTDSEARMLRDVRGELTFKIRGSLGSG